MTANERDSLLSTDVDQKDCMTCVTHIVANELWRLTFYENVKILP